MSGAVTVMEVKEEIARLVMRVMASNHLYSPTPSSSFIRRSWFNPSSSFRAHEVVPAEGHTNFGWSWSHFIAASQDKDYMRGVMVELSS